MSMPRLNTGISFILVDGDRIRASTEANGLGSNPNTRFVLPWLPELGSDSGRSFFGQQSETKWRIFTAGLPERFGLSYRLKLKFHGGDR